jgi:hypothetical protein
MVSCKASMCTIKVPVLVKARVRKKYMLAGKIAERAGKIAPAMKIISSISTSLKILRLNY